MRASGDTSTDADASTDTRVWPPVRRGGYRRTMPTPLPEIDDVQVASFWRRFLATGAGFDASPDPPVAECFGDSVEMADELVTLVLRGRKRATAGAVVDHERGQQPLPRVGDLWIAADGRGRPRAVLRTTEVRIGPLSSVDTAFAWDEGEGDRTREDWLVQHEHFFRRYLPTIDAVFDEDLPTVFERFEVLWAPEEDPAAP